MTAATRNILTVIAAPHWGGLHVVAERTTPFYEDAGYRRFVALPAADPQVRNRLESAGCVVIPLQLARIRKTLNPLNHSRFARRFGRDVRAIEKIAAEHAIDLIEVAGLLNLQPAVAARRLAMPLVWQLHGTSAPVPVRHLFGRIAAAKADVVMTSGAGMAVRHRGLDRILPQLVSFSAPVDVDRFRPDERIRRTVRADLGYGDSDIVVGTLGNRGWVKRHEFILELADRLRSSRLQFAIAGTCVDSNDAYYRQKVLEPLEALGLEGSVRIIEQRHPAEALMTAFDIFLLPSRAEGASLVTAEAMAVGLPIVASDVGSLSDIVEQGVNGYLCPANSPSSFCGALEALTDGGRRREMGAASRARALAELSERRCADAHFTAYRRALQRR